MSDVHTRQWWRDKLWMSGIVISLLGRIGGTESVPALSAMLSRDQSDVLVTVTAALGSIADRASPVIKPLLAEPGWPQQQPAPRDSLRLGVLRSMSDSMSEMVF